MNQLEYVPGIGGASVQLDGPSSFVGIAENLRSREWEYDLGYRDLVSATRPAREVDVTFNADYETADELRRVADADITARTPGTFIAQKDWRQRGYILASQPNDIHYGRLSTELKVALLDGAWWRLVDKTFAVEDTTPTYESATGKSVTTNGAANVPLHALTVDGESVQDGTPTPDAPVDVQVVQGRNLLPKLIDSSTTKNGVTYTLNSDGTITANGTATAAAQILGARFFLPEGNYYLSGRTSGYTSSTVFMRLLEYTAQSGGSLITSFTDTGSGIAVSSPVGGCWAAVFINVANGTTVANALFKPQLEKGSTATPYTPYGSIGLKVGSTITPIDLQGNVLASLPDGTKDVLTVDSAGHVVFEKRVAFASPKAASSIGSSSGNQYVSTVAPINGTPTPTHANNIIGNRGVAARNAQNVGNMYVTAAGNTIVLVFANNTFASADEASAWLQANDTYFYYELATPQTIDLGYIDMPNVFDGAVMSITAEVIPTITAEWQTSPDIYLDYPHNYPYDYQKTSSTGSITPSVLTPSDVYLVIYGPAVNPYVIVGDNRYQVNVTVPSGGYLIVDGREKSIMLTLADGTVQNVFSSGVRGGGAGGGSYIFEKVPAGTSEVTYDGSFGFDLGWYEEEGEPPWNQS